MSNYVNRCGDCEYFELASNSYEKGYCEWVGTYYYPDANTCSHYSSRTNTSTCYITTIVCECLKFSDDCEVLKNFRTFRDEVLEQDEAYLPLLLEYDTVGPILARNIKEECEEEGTTICESIYEKFLSPTSSMITRGDYDGAIEKYSAMLSLLRDYYSVSTASLPDLIKEYDYTKGGHGRVYKKVNNNI